MIWRRRHRRARQRGFVMAEALVALAVAALTLALMTSATWGLRQTALAPSPLQQEATDWLTTRRVLQAWAGSATTNGVAGLPGRFFGTPSEVRFVLDDGTIRASEPITIQLQVRQEDGLFHLTATRHVGVRDVRLIGDNARRSTLLISDQPLQFAFQLVAPINSAARLWTYEPQYDQGLPTAIALEQAGRRMVTARLPATRSIACVSRLGIAGLTEQDCEIR